MRNKPDPKTVLRTLVAYPAVFVPNYFGGFDVFFPNFPGSETAGLNLSLARKAAREELSARFYHAFRDGAALPAPSDAGELFQDDEEVPGTRVLMVEPDKDWILRRLGLGRKPTRSAPTGEKYTP